MKLVEALKLTASPAVGGPPKRVLFATGFTPLHLGTYARAHLAARGEPGVALQPGVFEDLVGTVERAVAEPFHAAAVVIEWADLDPRLGTRRNGGWKPADAADVVGSAERTFARLAAAVRALAERCAVAVVLPTLPLPPLFHTAGWQLSPAEAALRAVVAGAGRELTAVPRVRVVGPHRIDAQSPISNRFDLRSELATGFLTRSPTPTSSARCSPRRSRPRPRRRG
jgi:hypothetical protein